MKITELQLNNVSRRILKNKGIHVKFDKSVLAYLAEKGFDKAFGALKPRRDGRLIRCVIVGDEIDLGNSQISAHGHPSDGGLGQSRVVDALQDQIGQHALNLSAYSFRSVE